MTSRANLGRRKSIRDGLRPRETPRGISLSLDPNMTIPESGVAALKYPLDSAWKHNPLEYGGGVVAQAEAFRRLPCLVGNILAHL